MFFGQYIFYWLGVPGEQLPVWAYDCRSLPVCPYYDGSCYRRDPAYQHNSGHHHNNNPAHYDNGGHHNDHDPAYHDNDYYYYYYYHHHHHSGFLRQ